MQNDTVAGFWLSPQQRHLWRLQSTEISQPFSAIGIVAVRGPLDLTVLRAALRMLTDRYEILRTTFRCLSGTNVPAQVISEIGGFVLDRIAPEERDGGAGGDPHAWILARALEIRFELGSGPLLHALLLPLSGDEHVLCLCLPALCADSAGLENLVRELGLCYGAALSGRGLGEVDAQYADISEALNEIARSEETKAGREHWRRSGLLGRLGALPWKAGAGGDLSFLPRAVDLVLPTSDLRAVEDLRRQGEGGVEAFFLACWAALIWRLGAAAPVIGVRQSGRGEGFESVVGLLAKFLPVSFDPSAAASFAEFRTEVAGRLHEAAEWQDYFDREALDGESAAAWPWAFETDAPEAAHRADDINFAVRRLHACIDRFEIKLAVHRGESLALSLHYDANRVAREEVEKLAGAFSALLSGALSRPDLPLDRLEILDAGACRRLLSEFNATALDYPRDACLHQLFERQVARAPEALAVIDGERRLTYAELNARANQVAAFLREVGVGPDARVGLCVERSVEMLTGLWGILKAGGAYVPLDPSYPRERLSFLLNDSRALVLLTVRALEDRLETPPIPVLHLDELEVLGDGLANPASGATAESLAYVIYTSGSTGMPKGVMVPHRGVVNYLSWCAQAYAVAAGEGAPVGSPLGFDLTVTSLLSPLLAGRTVSLLAEEEGAGAIVKALREARDYSLIKITPLHLDILSEALTAGEARGRTHAIILGGEALRAESLAFWRENAPATRLINEYGPTETVVGCAWFEVPASHSFAGAVPIGRPVVNAQIYVVDAALRPVLEGMPGELLIGGDGVTRGYLNRPDLTAECFVPDPWSGRPGARLYRSGDLGRHRSDGQLEFLGRIDGQVKIRGHRVEPGEVEAALLRHPAVRAAAVVPSAPEEGHRRLLAYFVPRQEPAPSTEDLHSFLAASLPGPMIPASFVPLPALPLTANGKVDRKALESTDHQRPSLSQSFVEPGTWAERTLAGIWRDVLQLERVGIHDNFFHLGGDSILSIQIVARANRAGLSLEPAQMFQHQTIAALAALSGASDAAEAEQGPVTGEVPLTPIQHRFFEQEQTALHHYNQAVLLALRQRVEPDVLERALGGLLEHHDALRLRFTPEARGWRQLGVEPGTHVPMVRFDLTRIPAAARPAAIEAAASTLQGSLDLGRGPLLRAGFFDLGPDEQARLVLIFHHLVVDGVSWRVLLEDLEALCRGEGGACGLLPPKTSSFKRWAERLAERAGSEEILEELEYWLSEPRRVATPLPIDFDRGPNSVESARVVHRVLDPEETRVLLHEIPRVYQTQINDILLSALVQACAAWTGRRSLLIDLEGHGRDALAHDAGVDVARTVGWFTAVFPVLLDIAGLAEADEILLAIKEQLRGFPRQGTGYGVLRYLSGDERALFLPELPQAELEFNYLGQLDQLFPPSSLFAPAPESSGSPRAASQLRSHLLEVGGNVNGGRLCLSWTYSANRHQRATIERLADSYFATLRLLLGRCRQAPDVGLELPGLGLDREEMDRLIGSVEFEG
jgi:amino acid adenylation domain-containing protein/non-ribosomal peptide synthase protein (TIGR01720 family)